MSQRKVYERVERFRGRLTCNGEARSRRSSAVTYVEVKEQIDHRIRDNRKMGIGEIVFEI
jgi:hypothetical protein